MASAEELWASYFYPETYDPATRSGTMRNKFGERDPDVLAVAEYSATSVRERQLRSGAVEIPRTFDAAHVLAIHRHLFEPVYEWAGEYRTVQIRKGPSPFADITNGDVDRYLGDVHRFVEAAAWSELDHDQFAERAATVFAYLNQAHPFREGNGRTAKLFMEHVAERSGFALDYDRVSEDRWNSVSRWSAPDAGKYEPFPRVLIADFKEIAVARPPSTPAGKGTAPSIRALLAERTTRRPLPEPPARKATDRRTDPEPPTPPAPRIK